MSDRFWIGLRNGLLFVLPCYALLGLVEWLV